MVKVLPQEFYDDDQQLGDDNDPFTASTFNKNDAQAYQFLRKIQVHSPQGKKALESYWKKFKSHSKVTLPNGDIVPVIWKFVKFSDHRRCFIVLVLYSVKGKRPTSRIKGLTLDSLKTQMRSIGISQKMLDHIHYDEDSKLFYFCSENYQQQNSIPKRLSNHQIPVKRTLLGSLVDYLSRFMGKPRWTM
jgi:hypothetical protein